LNAPEAPVFREPWEAQAFALVVALCDRGAFTWAEWTGKLSQIIGAAESDGDGSAYYEQWLTALEQLVAEKGLVAPPVLSRRKEAWRRAAEATPHGSPILLENDPLAHA
jgi:nitrile hydratase accessory protein